MKTVNELLQESIELNGQISELMRSQVGLNETARDDMIAQANATGQGILNMMTPVYGVHNIYVDGGVSGIGIGTLDDPYKAYGDALRSLPSNRASKIHLKAGYKYDFGEAGNSYDFVEVFSPSITTTRWGSTSDPDPVLNAEHLIASNGYVYPKTGLTFKCPSSFYLQNVNLKGKSPVNYDGEPHSGLCVVYPHFGAVLSFSTAYSDIVIDEGMRIVSPYFTCPNLAVDTYNGSLSGGGDLVMNSHGAPITVGNPTAMAIAADTYILDRVYGGQNLNVTSAYQGSQLARS